MNNDKNALVGKKRLKEYLDQDLVKYTVNDNVILENTDYSVLINAKTKNNKTIVVEVVRKFKHPFYEKVIKRTKKYHAHDEKNKFKEGEKVSIVECKPISKKKTWQVIE